jgi:c(7)-type cytochrome triheme protein
MKRILLAALVAGALLWTAVDTFAQDKTSPKAVYDANCVGCHGSGVLNAPKFGDAAAWAPRAKAGIDALVKRATAGTSTGMPPKGGRPDLNAAQLRAVIEYMMAGGGGAKASEAAAKPAAPGKAEPKADAKADAKADPKVAAKAQDKPADRPTPAATAPASAASGASTLAAAPPAAPAAPAATVAAARAAAPNPPVSAEVNAFNRLLKPLGRFNRPAAESGIHDPANDMTLQLQPPATAFIDLPKSMAGNHVDWVKSLDGKKITPRWDRLDPATPAVVMDLNIVREVKGSMPDVVYPHKQHTEWLDCSNCHPAIFLPQKGANQISMASILLGQKCGVCHGKVAFPVSECRLCHSKKKAESTIAAERKP